MNRAWGKTSARWRSKREWRFNPTKSPTAICSSAATNTASSARGFPRSHSSSAIRRDRPKRSCTRSGSRLAITRHRTTPTSRWTWLPPRSSTTSFWSWLGASPIIPRDLCGRATASFAGSPTKGKSKKQNGLVMKRKKIKEQEARSDQLRFPLLLPSLLCAVHEQVAFARLDDSQGAAVGGKLEVAKGEPVQYRLGLNLRDRHRIAGRLVGDRDSARQAHPSKIAGAAVESSLDQNAPLVRLPLIASIPDAHARHTVRRRDVADFEQAVIAEVSHLRARGGDGKPSQKTFEDGEFAARLFKQIERHQARRPGETPVALDGHRRILLGVPRHGGKHMVGKKPSAAPGHRPHALNRIEQLGFDRLGEIDHRDAVAQPGGIGGLRYDAVGAGDSDLFSVVVNEQGQDSFLRVAPFVDHPAGEHLHGQPRAVRSPAQRLDGVAERCRPSDQLLSVDDAFALAICAQHPDVVPLYLQSPGGENVFHGVSDAAVGRVGECCAFIVYRERGGSLRGDRGGEEKRQKK